MQRSLAAIVVVVIVIIINLLFVGLVGGIVGINSHHCSGVIGQAGGCEFAAV